MSTFGGLLLTNRGRNLQAKAQAGAPLVYTRIKIGDGQLGTSPIFDLIDLKHPVMSLPISKLKVMNSTTAVIGTSLNNNAITVGFYFREIGIFATDPDLGEILYCYGNAGAQAEYIPPGGGPDLVEKSIDVQVLTGNAANISAIIDQSLIFETPAGAQEKADAAEEAAKDHSDQALATHWAERASLTKVGHTQLSSATNSDDETKSATPKAVKAIADALVIVDKNAAKKVNGYFPLRDANLMTDFSSYAFANDSSNTPPGGDGWATIANFPAVGSVDRTFQIGHNWNGNFKDFHIRKSDSGSRYLPWAKIITEESRLWSYAVLQNGWGGTLAYRRNAVGQLEVGLLGISVGTRTTGILVATLPEGFRPVDIGYINLVSPNNVFINGGMTIDPGGSIKVWGTIPTNVANVYSSAVIPINL